MRHHPIFAVALAVGAALFSAPAAAQNTQSWVSSTGSDANACTRAAPCAGFARAIQQTNAGGRVQCVDRVQAVLAAVLNITKSLTIDCEGSSLVRASAGGTAININSATAVVRLRGLAFEGAGVGNIAISVISASEVHVDRIRSSGFERHITASAGSVGIFVTDSVFTGSTDFDSASLFFNPSNGSTRIGLTRVTVAGNAGTGILVFPTSTGSVSVMIRDSIISDNGRHGLRLDGAAEAVVHGAQVARNAQSGLSSGSGTSEPPTVVSDSTITGNTTGISVNPGRQILSAGGNVVTGNGTNGAFTGTVSAQ